MTENTNRIFTVIGIPVLHYCHKHAKIPDRTKLAVPSDWVANEYYVYKRIYQKKDSTQEIVKSTWFKLNEYEKDKPMYEYCIVTLGHNTVLSVIWEN
jgi:hypothetical protein